MSAVTPGPKTRGNRTLRTFDRYLGIPAVALLALRRTRRMPAEPRRIGLMKTAAIGDTLLLSGVVADVRRSHPDAAIVLITGRDNYGAGELLGSAVDERIVIDPHRPIRSARAIRAGRLDVIVDFGSWPRFDAWLAAMSGASFRVGFETAGQHRHFAFDRTVEHSDAVHESVNYARLAQILGVEPHTAPHIHPPRALSADRFPPAPYAVFHPWSGGYMHAVKEWADDRWVTLAKRLADRGWTIVLTGSRGEAPRTARLATAMNAAGVSAFDASGAFTLPELADVLARSVAVVAVNTGVAHLAGLVGAPTVSLEGPTPPRRWQPLGPQVRPVTTDLPNCGFLNLGFEYDGRRADCMDGISIDAVIAAVDELLSSSAITV